MRLSRRRPFNCSLEEKILERVLHFETILDVQKCPNDERIIKETKLEGWDHTN